MVNRLPLADLDDEVREALARVKSSLADRTRTTTKAATKGATAAPRIAANSPVGKQITSAIAALRGLVAGDGKQPARSQPANRAKGTTTKISAKDQPRRTPTASQRSAMHAAAAEHTAKVTPGMISRLEEEQRRRRVAKGLPAFAKGGVTKGRSTSKAKAGAGMLPLPRTTATKASSRRSTSRGGARRGR